ncbi:unnamed protein product [Litomosoides sigmodontis]|uniref:Uncharacterized protein n=1 Tax=Litomosoides sigmodontis TaxID=42156 RepID=A0A3P6U407_LITSI|nr:unnamed protein product [Litomosoides sigmodontis]
MFRKKQLDLQMLAAMKNAKIRSKANLCFQEQITPQMSYVPRVQSSRPEQYARLLNSGSPSITQTIPPNTETKKIAKQIEDLPASTARSPSQKMEKNGKLSTEKDNKADVGNKEPEIQQYKADIPTSNNDRSDKRKRKKSKKKRKSKMNEETKDTRKSSDEKYPQSTTMPQRYRHQIPPDNVHEWISRIAHSTSPIPYFSPNKRILLIPEPTNDLNDKNEEENEENNDTLGETESNAPGKSTHSSSHTNAEEVETDVEISTETKERTTPRAPTIPTPASASINTPPSSAFLDDQPYWRKEKQQKYLKMGANSNINHAGNTGEKAKEKILWNLPDKRAEARLNRSLENSWLCTVPTAHSRTPFSREEQPIDAIRRLSHQP